MEMYIVMLKEDPYNSMFGLSIPTRMLGPFPESWQAIGPCLDEARKLMGTSSWEPMALRKDLESSYVSELTDPKHGITYTFKIRTIDTHRWIEI